MKEYNNDQLKAIMSFMNINQPRNEEQGKLRDKEFLYIVNQYAIKEKTFKSGKWKDYHIYSLLDHKYLVTPNKESWILINLNYYY